MSMLGPPLLPRLPPSAYGLDNDAAYLDDNNNDERQVSASSSKATTRLPGVSSPASSQNSLSYWSAPSSSSSSISNNKANNKASLVAAYALLNASTSATTTTEDTKTMMMSITTLPIENMVHIATYLTTRDIRNLASTGSYELRTNLIIGPSAIVDLWTMKMQCTFPRIFSTTAGGGSGAGLVVTFVNDRKLPIPAIRRPTEKDTDVDNLPLLVSLMPTQYPQCIDPRTLMLEDDNNNSDEVEDEDFDVNNEGDFLRMMLIGAGIIDRLRHQQPQQQQQPLVRHGGAYDPISRQGRNQQRQLRRLNPIISNSNANNGGGCVKLFDVYDITVTDRMMMNPTASCSISSSVVNDDNGTTIDDSIKTNTIKIDCASPCSTTPTTTSTSREVVQVIQFVGERVGTGDRCIRSNFPFPPTCRRLQSSTSSLLNPLVDSVEQRINRIDSSSSMVTDDDESNTVSSTGRIIMTRCKRTILNKVNSFRKRSLSSLDDPIRHRQPQQSKILCPFVIPTVISNEGRLIVDVTPGFVAYFEVTIVKLPSSSSSSSIHHATALQQQQQQQQAHHQAVARNERLRAMDNANMNNNNNNRWQQRERQREGWEVRGRQSFNNHGPWMVPMMMMPMHPIPLELVTMMNALDWNRPFQLGVVGGARRNTGGGGGFVGQQEEEHQRREQELLRREQQRHQQRRGLDRWDADARRWRQPLDFNVVNDGDNDVLPPLSRHECVAIGLSTRRFSPTDKMPGWDDQSFGFHSDDGGTYHGRGDMLRRYGPTYGPGDTVGCGLDYITRRIFFVKNGVFLGYAFGNRHDDFGRNSDHISASGRLSKAIVNSGLYPTVGIDSKCPIAVNFGERPFRFDLKCFASASMPMSRNRHS